MWWNFEENILVLGGPCSMHGKSCMQGSGGPEGKRPRGKFIRRWEDNIKVDLQEVCGGDTNWINLAQDRDRWRAVVNAVMNLHDP